MASKSCSFIASEMFQTPYRDGLEARISWREEPKKYQSCLKLNTFKQNVEVNEFVACNCAFLFSFLEDIKGK